MRKIDHSPFAPVVARTFARVGPWVPRWMSANHISLLGLMAAALLAVLLCFASVSRWMYVAGALLMLVQWSADNLDGVVARTRGQTSGLGYYLDHFGDTISTVLVGVSAFAGGGSHLAIGLACTVVYLVAMSQVHIKIPILDTMELPKLGPTESSFLVAAVLLGQAMFDYGQPLSWFPAITGTDGALTRLLGFSTGLTFIDVCGLLSLITAVASVAFEIGHTVGQLRAFDAGRRPADLDVPRE